MTSSRHRIGCVLAAVVVALPGVTACSDSTTPQAVGSGDLAPFYDQRISWTPCAADSGADDQSECATITVPLDYADPHGKTIEVAISRVASTDPDRRRGVILTNPGGPGGRGLGFPARLRVGMTPDVAAAYDVIGMDTRGLGESTPLDCGLRQMSWMWSPGPTDAGWDESVSLAREAADSCWDRYSDYLPNINTQNIARDLDVIRGALGVDKASFFGWSYGTFLGATYSQMFPDRIDRLVLDSAPDPKKYGYRMLQAMGDANEKAVDDFATWAAARDETYGLGATRQQVRGLIENLIAGATVMPIRIGDFTIDEHFLPFLLYVNGTDDTEEASETFADTLVQLREAATGQRIGSVNPRLLGLLNAWSHPESGPGADYAATMAIVCGDVSMSRDPHWYRTQFDEHREAQPIFAGIHNPIMPCAFWRSQPPARIDIDNAVPTLQIQATGDTRTTYQEGLGMHEAMKGSRLVTVNGRTHGVFPEYANACANAAVNRYLHAGTLPSEDTVCA
ncbi:alpha/beta fold hydrolase [Mycolicibacterium sp. YH-1]|uniref:alpha/beta fold hydrolase n=1 Tax=Mycolicibacterium sp. YH-1 TaxID=2908837 RepID=UPI001F4C062B|nr:alpha/beta fold hydrolase [Mycolicibacterium sp. YH-1]UNB51519.1 alpha/beta hydrolase [Mycolicibacterium sp. YH-1]